MVVHFFNTDIILHPVQCIHNYNIPFKVEIRFGFLTSKMYFTLILSENFLLKQFPMIIKPDSRCLKVVSILILLNKSLLMVKHEMRLMRNYR